MGSDNTLRDNYTHRSSGREMSSRLSCIMAQTKRPKRTSICSTPQMRVGGEADSSRIEEPRWP